MKRLISLVLTFILVSLISATAFANTDTMLIYKAEAGESVEEMLVNLKEAGYHSAYKAELSNDLGVKFEVDVYAVDTSALSRSGEKSISYLASLSDAKLVASTRAGFWDEYWDKTGSVLFSMTITYSTNSSNYIQMTNVKGEYSIKQSGIQVAKQSVVYRQLSAYVGVEEYGAKYPTSSSFNYDTGFTEWVPNNEATQVFGANWSGTINRGSDSWKFEFLNYKYL